MTATAEQTDWIVRERVPVYDAHELEITDRTGKVVRTEKVTAERLQKIADARNAKIERTGDQSPLIIGHTKKGVPEWDQPPIAGYADNYEVGPHEKDGRPTLYARYLYYPTTVIGRGENREELSADEVMRRFPRRSPEIWLDDNDLDAISLLGPTTPARYLGLVRMSKVAEVEMPPEAPAAPPEAPPAAPAGGDQCQELCMALMTVIEQFMGGGAPVEPASPVGPNDASPTPAQYAACGPTNANLPELEKVRMQKDQDAIRSRRVEDEVKSLRAELDEQKTLRRKEQYERRLIQLEAENYDIVRDEELKDLLSMSEEGAEKHFGRIKSRYQRNGSGTPIRTADLEDVQGGNIFRDTPELQKAEAYMLRNKGMMFNEALAAVKAGKV